MKKFFISTLICILIVSFTSSAFAGKRYKKKYRKKRTKQYGRQHSLHMDVIRVLDEVQYDGLFNMYYQISLDRRTGAVAGFSTGNDAGIFELAYKRYLGRYFAGPYGQIGVAFGDFGGETEFGVAGSIGYERALVKRVIAGIAVEMLIGSMDNYVGGSRPIFRPMLNIMYAF